MGASARHRGRRVNVASRAGLPGREDPLQLEAEPVYGVTRELTASIHSSTPFIAHASLFS